jgi:hypothetical protein
MRLISKLSRQLAEVMNTETVEKPKSTAAPGPYMGFALQPVRLSYHLLRENDDVLVGLEYFDDVSVHYVDGHVVLEQSKNSIVGKPITDKSLDLWKSLANWADTCQLRALNPGNVTFVLYAGAPGAIGSLVTELHAAIDDAAAQAVLVKIKKLVPMPTDKGFGVYAGSFLAHGEEMCLAIIRNFQFQSDLDPLEPIRQQLRSTLTEDAVTNFAASAIGMAKDMAEDKLRKGETPLVRAGDFRNRFRPFVRKYNLVGLLVSTTGTPSDAEIEKTIASAPMFVRQLNAIEMKADIVVGAVGACLRTTADKTKWADEGTIVADSLDEFNESLVHRFALVRDEIADTHATVDCLLRGRLTYRRCAEVQLPLEGNSVPAHFVEGAYNILADTLTVGWHPTYIDLLGKD